MEARECYEQVQEHFAGLTTAPKHGSNCVPSLVRVHECLSRADPFHITYACRLHNGAFEADSHPTRLRVMARALETQKRSVDLQRNRAENT